MKKHLALAVLLVTLLSVAPVTSGAGYPEKPITYIIAFDPGGESDITARLQQKYLEEILGVKIIITYKPGGGGALGWSELVRAKPDGYTIAGDNLPHIVLQPLQRGNAGYETMGMRQIYCFESTPNALVVKKDSPFKTLKDFIEYAKKRPKAITVGGSASWSANHLGVLKLEKAAGLQLTYIPFTGSGTAAPALLGGHVTALMTYTTVAAQYREQMRVLGVMAPTRSKVLPDAPTFREQGYDLIEGAYRGVAAPPGTPDSVIKVLEDAFDKVNRNPEFQKKMLEMAFDLEFMGSEEFTKFVAAQIPEYTEILRQLGALAK